jgi:hypothetical protein
VVQGEDWLGWLLIGWLLELASSRAGGGDAVWGHAEAIRGCQRCRGRRPWGQLGAPVASLTHDIGTGKAEEGEKDTRKGLTGGPHM